MIFWRKISLIWTIVILCTVGYGQSSIDENILFDNTVKLIYEYSNDRKEYNGLEADSIRRNVLRIVYTVPNSIISIEKKIDILHLMLYFQRYSAEAYRTEILYDFLQKDSVSFKDVLYVLPIAFCDYCTNDVLLRIKNLDKIELQREILLLKEPYKSYYKNLLSFAVEKSSSDSMDSVNFLFRLIVKNLLFSDQQFQKKYSSFFSKPTDR